MTAYAYTPDLIAPYGPVWGRTCPPGLPAEARQCSSRADAKHLLNMAFDEMITPIMLRQTLIDLAQTESGCILGRPANSFDVRPQSERPINPKTGKRKPYVSAIGVWSWNAPCWRAVTGRVGLMPWQMSVEEEIMVPLAEYTRLWAMLPQTLPNKIKVCHIRLWHRSPAEAKALRARLDAGMGAEAAWAQVDGGHRQVIERHWRRVSKVIGS